LNPSTSKIKILALVPYKVFPAVMGGQKGIALFYKFLSQFANLEVLTTQKNEPKENYLVHNVLSNHFTRYISPKVYFLLRSFAKKHEATHILFEHPYYAWLIIWCKWFTSYKLIVHSHNIESERFKSVGKWWWRILWHYERMAYKAADHVWFKTNEDRQYAIQSYKLGASKTAVIPYGIEQSHLPSASDILEAKKSIRSLHDIEDHELIMLFNGTLNYKPNLDALLHILDDILPLLKQANQPFKILICGKNLPAELDELKAYSTEGIRYAGFVEDIDMYFKACDIFLNPLLDGGGIKTKLVEALGFGKQAISTSNGAIGVDANCTNGRLTIVNDGDWQAFAKAVIEAMKVKVSNDNHSFYEVFSWKHIAEKAMQELKS
jgi:glycosyltransferase involved in cell wall biosynthesis